MAPFGHNNKGMYQAQSGMLSNVYVVLRDSSRVFHTLGTKSYFANGIVNVRMGL